MSESSSRTKSEGGAFFVLVVIALVVACWYLGMFPHYLHGQTVPNLVVSAGSGNLAPNLNVTSDSALSWKAFSVTSGTPGSYQVLWAESDGTTGGIYVGTVSTSATAVGIVNPAPPPADTLPIAGLTSTVSAAAAGIDAGAVTAMSAGYETLAKEIDAGAISSPTQLYLAAGVQLLALSDSARTALQPVTNTVKAWLNAQQTAKKLDETRMKDYARVLHAVAAALKPTQSTGCPAVTPAAGYVRAPTSAHVGETPPPRLTPSLATGSTTGQCPNGKCPAPGGIIWTHRWRPWLDQ